MEKTTIKQSIHFDFQCTKLTGILYRLYIPVIANMVNLKENSYLFIKSLESKEKSSLCIP